MICLNSFVFILVLLYFNDSAIKQHDIILNDNLLLLLLIQFLSLDVHVVLFIQFLITSLILVILKLV